MLEYITHNSLFGKYNQTEGQMIELLTLYRWIFITTGRVTDEHGRWNILCTKRFGDPKDCMISTISEKRAISNMSCIIRTS